MEILQHGAVDSKGNRLYGHADARAHALVKITEVDRDLSLQGAPEGDIREEGADILAAYAEGKQRRLEGRSKGILFGIDELDEKTDGLQKADLCLMVGFSSSGKTSMCSQLAWHAVTQQSKNVVFLTTETIRAHVTRKIIARHSKLPQFDIPEGIDSDDLKKFKLSPELEDKFREVVSDFTRNPEYGKCHVAQVPQGATMGMISAQLMRIQRQFPIDLAVMDYFGLLHATRRRKDMREELSDIIKEAKQFATTFDDGNGLPFVSPWQISRAARDNARVSGGYTSAALAETSEATNSPDLLISVLEPEDNNDRYAMLKGQILKARDGITSASIMIQADYATSTFSSPSTASSFDSLIS
jgi:replicative DNA helicase